MYIANTRVLIMQEAKSEHDFFEKTKNIRNYLNDSDLQEVLQSFDFSQYPTKLKAFTKCMKKRNAILALFLATVQNSIKRGKQWELDAWKV